MTRVLLVFLAMCAFTIAMVPKDRRAANSEEPLKTTPAVVCERQTPCGWAVYKSHQEIIEFNITNTYCLCGPGTFCVQDEFDPIANSNVYRCREPGENKTDK